MKTDFIDLQLQNPTARFVKHTLQFKRPSGTSRGVLTEKPVWYIIIETADGKTGIGECSPIWDLSVEKEAGYEDKVAEVCERIAQYPFWLDSMLTDYPSIRFGLEMAVLDAHQGGRRVLYKTPFTEGADSITINGLIWMGSKEYMLEQIAQKLELGFRCVKMKIGAIEFEKELEVLKHIRQQYEPEQIELRVDANGAFPVDEAMDKLQRLSELQLHSIEQPIKAGNWEAMRHLCEETPLPIALDEELIGVPADERRRLLEVIEPQYIILKPSLLGGISVCEHWIELADELGVGWWVTSALESNVGLNAIAQWTYTLANPMPQGLGTGQLYTNNIKSPLHLKGEELWYDVAAKWGLEDILES